MRYSRPTLTRKRSRSRTSLTMGPATSGSRPGLPPLRSGKPSTYVERGGDRHLDHLADVAAAEQHRQALRLEAPPVAGRARPLDHVRLELLAHRVRRRVAVAALDVAQDAFPARLVLAAELLALVAELDLLALDAVEQRLPRRGRQLLPRRVEVELQLAAQRGQDHLAQVAARLAPRQHHALEDRDVRSPPSASCSLTSRRVPRPPQSGQAPNGELNENWRGSSSGSERPHTGQRVALGEGHALGRRAAVAHHLHHAVGRLEGGLHAVGQALPVVRLDREAVHDDRDVVVLPAVELGHRLQLVHGAVHPGAHEARRGAPTRTGRGTRPSGRAPAGRAPRSSCRPARRAPCR